MDCFICSSWARLSIFSREPVSASVQNGPARVGVIPADDAVLLIWKSLGPDP